MPRRPTALDDDEQLLREQEAFLRQNEPSAKVVRMNKESSKAEQKEERMEIDEVQQVLFDIQEKMSIVESEKPAGHPDGFPKVFSLGNTDQIGGKKKGKSLFKQKMEERKKKQGGVSETRPPPRPIPVRSLVEDEKIGHENAERLAKVNFPFRIHNLPLFSFQWKRSRKKESSCWQNSIHQCSISSENEDIKEELPIKKEQK